MAADANDVELSSPVVSVELAEQRASRRVDREAGLENLTLVQSTLTRPCLPRWFWFIVLPGSLRSRLVYEQLRSTPVLLCLAWLLTPLASSEDRLNIATFTIVFHVLYASSDSGLDIGSVVAGVCATSATQTLHQKSVVAALVAVASYNLVVGPPPTRSTLALLVACVGVYAAGISAAVTSLSGVVLDVVAPATLLLVSIPMVLFLTRHAILVRASHLLHGRSVCAAAVVCGRQRRRRRLTTGASTPGSTATVPVGGPMSSASSKPTSTSKAKPSSTSASTSAVTSDSPSLPKSRPQPMSEPMSTSTSTARATPPDAHPRGHGPGGQDSGGGATPRAALAPPAAARHGSNTSMAGQAWSSSRNGDGDADTIVLVNVLGSPEMAAFRALVGGFVVLLLLYYWCQVYTARVVGAILDAVGPDSQWAFVAALTFQVSMMIARAAMGAAAGSAAFRKAGLSEDRAMLVGTVMMYGAQLLGSTYMRFVFLSFKDFPAMVVAIIQRFALDLAATAMTHTLTYWRVSFRIRRAFADRMGWRPPKRDPFPVFIRVRLLSFTFAKIGEFSSLVVWLASLTWLRLGYNSPVFPYDRTTVPDDTFQLYLSYAGLFILSELLVLFAVRTNAYLRGFHMYDAAMHMFRSRAARIAFVATACHVLQDVFVASVLLEPSSSWADALS